jgi:hypothetical protein
MIRHIRVTFGLLALSAALTCLTGCGGGTTKATGKVVQNGQPVTVSEKGMIQITFFKAEDTTGADPYPVDPKPDGTFEVVGKERKGVPPGKYRVSVAVFDPYVSGGGNDKLGGRYRRENTTLTVDVASGKEIVLEVGGK